MSNSKKIFDSLKKNSDKQSISEFLQAIFIEENKGLHQWNALYDEKIDEYAKRYLDED